MEYRMDIVKAKIKCVSLNLLFLYENQKCITITPGITYEFCKKWVSFRIFF